MVVSCGSFWFPRWIPVSENMRNKSSGQQGQWATGARLTPIAKGSLLGEAQNDGNPEKREKKKRLTQSGNESFEGPSPEPSCQLQRTQEGTPLKNPLGRPPFRVHPQNAPPQTVPSQEEITKSILQQVDCFKRESLDIRVSQRIHPKITCFVRGPPNQMVKVIFQLAKAILHPPNRNSCQHHSKGDVNKMCIHQHPPRMAFPCVPKMAHTRALQVQMEKPTLGGRLSAAPQCAALAAHRGHSRRPAPNWREAPDAHAWRKENHRKHDATNMGAGGGRRRGGRPNKP